MHACIVSGPRLLRPPHPAPQGSAGRVAKKGIPPPLAPPSQSFATTVTGIELVGATINATVLVFGGWDRHRDVKPPMVAGTGIFGCHVSSDFRKFATCGATSHLEYSISSWHDIVLCMIVFVFCGGRLQNTVRTGTESTNQTTGGGDVGCSCNAPRVRQSDGYTTATGAPSAEENRQNRYLQCSSNRNKDDNATIDK